LKKESSNIAYKPVRQVRKRRVNIGLLGVELEKASRGLYQPSESYCGYQFFLANLSPQADNKNTLDAETFLAALGITIFVVDELQLTLEEFITEEKFEDFFPEHEYLIEQGQLKESKKFRALEKLLQKRLGDVKVFRVGRVEVRCYICGLVNDGKIAGLVTTKIKT